MRIPDELKYSSDHEWAAVENNRVRVGITDYAQDALGDVVFVDLPKIGTKVTVSQSIGEVESTKSVSEIYSPVSGTVVAVNDALGDSPQSINEDPYGSGWICEIELDDVNGTTGLLDADGYRAITDH
jgi:glycine cleavage system H protein